MLCPTWKSSAFFEPQEGPASSSERSTEAPSQVHIWGGISQKGATPIVIFTRTLIATRYTDILDVGLVPFLEECFPEGHRFQQDNDPKHTSRYTQDYYGQKGINWWLTQTSSQDLNPIENVWGTLKRFLRNELQPRTIAELKAGIKQFWKTLTPAVCTKYVYTAPYKGHSY